MGLTKFQRVTVIGYGTVTLDVLQCVFNHSIEYGYSVSYIEHEVHPFNTAKKYADSKGIPAYTIEDRDELKQYFLKTACVPILIISASNNYLFPKELVEKENVTIINFHNALLPEYPGRNAPSWVIYDQRKKTGITWHYVTTGIDEGNIIAQRQCEIPSEIKAFELAAVLMKLAADSFKDIIDDVLTGVADSIPQTAVGNRKLFKSGDIPGGGRFRLSDDPGAIYRLLRSLDYGKNNIFPPAQTVLEGKQLIIRRYKLVDNNDRKESDFKLYIPYDNEQSLMLRYEIVDDVENRGGGVIDSIEMLYAFVDSLKRKSRRLASNLYLSEDELLEAIENEELNFWFKENRYLNLWKYEKDYARLYYFIAESESYDVPKLRCKIVCDLFYSRPDERFRLAKNALMLAGMTEYAFYQKWSRASVDTGFCRRNSETEAYCIVKGRADGFFEMMKQCFDKYSDFIPTDDAAESFLDTKTCWSVLSSKTQELKGGMVITKRGNVQEEDYVFVADEERGKGIAKALHTHWYLCSDKKTIKFQAWIRNDNIASLKLHNHFGYTGEKAYKITLLKG